MIVDYHNHLEEGDFTLAWLGRFVETAEVGGVDEVGFTEHSYRFHQAADLLDNDWARRQEKFDLDDYVRLVTDARAAGYPVKLGIEVDYVPGREEGIAALLSGYPWDLVLGSVHWLGDWGIDLDPGTWPGRDVDGVYREYFATLRQAAASGLFDVLAHPDLVKIFGHRPASDLGDIFAETVAAVAAADICLEVSSAGLRKPVGEIYPSSQLLDLAARHGVPVTLASDAHHPRDVGYAFPRLIEHARAAGYSRVAVFAGRRRRLEPLGDAALNGAG